MKGDPVSYQMKADQADEVGRMVSTFSCAPKMGSKQVNIQKFSAKELNLETMQPSRQLSTGTLRLNAYIWSWFKMARPCGRLWGEENDGK